MKKAWIPLAAVCALVVGIYAYMARLSIVESLDLQTFTRNAADAWYNLLVQGFRAGQLSLKKEVPRGLAQLADPYDQAANARYRTVPYNVQDLSYYKGRFYLYFGVTPALILFWPFVALTGRYLFHQQGVAIFCAVGFLASTGLLWDLWRRYFAEVHVGVVAACALALGLATGAPVLLSRPQVYEVAVSCGYMLAMLALAAIWCALHDPKRGWRWLAAASVAYGLAIGARPNLLFGVLILLIPVAQAWHERRPIRTLLVAATGPIVFIGLALMLYNLLRFDNPFESGLHYQLNIGQTFSLHYLWFNLRVYFLQPARWSGRFPFVHDAALPPPPAGYGAALQTFGVLTNIPLAWLALVVPLAWRNRSEQAASILRWFAMAVALFLGICALTLSLFWSACFRYEAEFLPASLLLAAVGILGLERVLAPTPTGQADRRLWRIVTRCGWGLLTTFSVAFNLLLSVENYAKTHDYLGVLLARMGRVQEAVGHFEQALRIKPDFAQAQNNLGNALLQAGKVQAAIGHYEQALRLRPDYAEADNNLGIALQQLGKVPEAMEHYERALRLMPEHAFVQNNLAWLLATHTPAESGDPVRALTMAQDLCRHTGNRVALYLDTLAVAYAANDRFDNAIATAQHAVELARSAEETQLASQIEARLELYRAGRAYHETAVGKSLNNP
jgi:tetratricopeptide (TPR) repeat protein